MNLWIQRNNELTHSIPLKLKPVTTWCLKSKLVALEYYAKSTVIANAINRTQWWLRPLHYTSQYYDNNNNIFILASKILLGSKDLWTNVFRTLMCNVGKPWSKQVLSLVYTCSKCVR